MESSALALICRCKLCVRTFISKFSSLKSGEDEIVRGVQKKKKKKCIEKVGNYLLIHIVHPCLHLSAFITVSKKNK